VYVVRSSSSTAPREVRGILRGTLRVTVLDEVAAKGCAHLMLPCDKGAHTPDQKRAVHEVGLVLQNIYTGTAKPTRVVLVKEDGGGLVGLSVVSMTGDPALRGASYNGAPYVEALARHDDYAQYVMRDTVTTAGGIVMRATVEMVLGEVSPTPQMWARILLTNCASHTVFASEGFLPVPRDVSHTEQVIRLRRPSVPPPRPLDPVIYVPPGRTRTGLVGHRLLAS
jgi:hypothetical protein